MSLTIGFIGYGEAANAFVAGWRDGDTPSPGAVRAFDIKTDAGGDVRAAKLADYTQAGVTGCETPDDMARDADVIFSMVTADQALAAAKSVTGGIGAGSLYFDCNSCAPDTKRRAAELINAAGGRYVDVAVMLPVYPTLNKTPVLVSGPASEPALEAMAALGMVATHSPGELGVASSIKMVRSIAIKGFEAVIAECVLAGRRAGVDEIVLASLEETYSGFGWPERAAYVLERMMVHGKRRAAEMREVAITVDQLGLEGRMAGASVGWQQQIGDLELDAGDDTYHARADAILAALPSDDIGDQ